MTSVKRLPLTDGGYTRVNSHRYDELAQYEWFQCKGYACRRDGDKLVALHREIARPAEGLHVDHKNGDRLDNREVNLRVCTHAENMRNKRLTVANTSGYKGVFPEKRTGKWRACIRFDGRREYLGTHQTKEAAARAYDGAARYYFGEYAWLNFPDEIHPYQPVLQTSRFRGVSRHGNRWEALLTVKKVRIFRARFDDEIDAARAYDKAARKHLGDAACLNFPDGQTLRQAA